MRLLSNLLQRFIRQGTLRVRDADGKIHVFGERLPGPDVAIHLHDREALHQAVHQSGALRRRGLYGRQADAGGRCRNP